MKGIPVSHWGETLQAAAANLGDVTTSTEGEFLGLGEDGHTASLFPETPSYQGERLAMVVKGGDPDLRRVTLTYPVLNRARHVVFLVSGMEKAEIVGEVFKEGPDTFPAQMIRPVNGRLTWLMDRASSSFLSPEKIRQAIRLD